MKVNLLYNSATGIQEKTLGSWTSTNNAQILPIYFGQYARDIQDEEDNKANAIVIESLPAYSAEVWLHFVPEAGDPQFSSFTVYATPQILENGNSVTTFTNVKLYKGSALNAPDTIIEDGNASTSADYMVTAAQANKDPNSDPETETWLDIATNNQPYTVWQLHILNTDIQSLSCDFYFKVVFRS